MDALLAARFEVHLVHPYGMKALRKRKRVKTDPRDPYELAKLLRLGSLPEAYIALPQLREQRELVRHRRQLVKLATAVKAGVRALLAKHNIRLPATDLHGDAATGLLDDLELPGTYATRLAAQRRLLLVLADEIAATEVDLVRRLKDHPGYRKLLTVKGIGPILAAVFVAEIGDVSPVPGRRGVVLLGRDHPSPLRVRQDGAPRRRRSRLSGGRESSDPALGIRHCRARRLGEGALSDGARLVGCRARGPADRRGPSRGDRRGRRPPHYGSPRPIPGAELARREARLRELIDAADARDQAAELRDRAAEARDAAAAVRAEQSREDQRFDEQARARASIDLAGVGAPREGT